MPRFVVLLIIGLVLAALATLALTLGHFVTPHLFASLIAHLTASPRAGGGCPAIIIDC